MGNELQGKTIAFLAADGVEKVELEQPRAALEQAGAHTEVVSLKSGEIQARDHDLDPAGTIRVYQADSRGNALFAGEDHIGHTPKDEEVSLHIGNAFDIVSEHKQTDYKAISSQVHEMEYEITLRNHKNVPVTVEVNEPIGGDWEMLDSSYKFTKTAAFAAQFEVPVEKDGTAVLRYRVRVHW